MDTRPEQVLDAHAHLAATFAGKDPYVVSFLGWFMKDAWEENKGRSHGLFYPVRTSPTHRPEKKDAAELAGIIGRSLQDAITYQVTDEMVTAMRDVYDNSMRAIEHIDSEEVPCETGFAWLDGMWEVASSHGGAYAVRVRAISWDLMSVRTDGTDAEKIPEQLWPCVRVSLWSHVDDDRGDSYIDQANLEDARNYLGNLTLRHTCVVPFGLRFTKPTDGHADSVDSMLGLVHILWMFLGMEIVGQHRPKIQNHWKKRALKSIKHGEVHVVLLRRLAHPDTGEEVSHRDVDWTCRWVVQGHWRHLEKPLKPHHAIATATVTSDGVRQHCLQCGGELVWVRPYIKGPDGKPLKVSRTLMKLAR